MIRFIPSLLTTINLICGFLIILINDIHIASLLFVIALVADVLDGATARWLKAESEIGKELDSLADLVSFGIAPAVLWYSLATTNPIVNYAVPCAYVAAGAWRLAIFNTLPPSKSFKGLAIPAAACMLMGLIFAYHHESSWVMQIFSYPSSYILIPLVISILMLSQMRMFSLKGISSVISKNIPHALLAFCIGLCLALSPYDTLWISVLAYIIISFFSSFFKKS